MTIQLSPPKIILLLDSYTFKLGSLKLVKKAERKQYVQIGLVLLNQPKSVVP